MTGEAPSGTSVSPSPAPPSTTPSISPTPTSDGRSPFTGRPGWVAKPVLVVKIPNTGSAQPHAGVKHADIVYVEEVEWSITRLAAVFSSNVPDVVGPVRSARITDMDLLAQFGRPAFAFSGAQAKMQPVLDAGPLFNVSAEKADQVYFRDSSRPGSDNEMVRAKEALRLAPDASLAKDIGLTFSPDAPAGGEPATSVSVTWPASYVAFDYQKDVGYAVTLNKGPAQDAEGGGETAATVVIQYVEQTDSGFGDRYGGHTPLAHVVGSGKALVFRDGRVWQVNWSRPSVDSGTSFTLADGSAMPFAIGQPWILLVNKTMKAKVG